MDLGQHPHTVTEIAIIALPGSRGHVPHRTRIGSSLLHGSTARWLMTSDFRTGRQALALPAREQDRARLSFVEVEQELRLDGEPRLAQATPRPGRGGGRWMWTFIGWPP